MGLDDAELTAFDHATLAHDDAARTEELLAAQPELFRNHLVVARWLDGWAGEVAADGALPAERREGIVQGLTQVAAHLRQGDLLPGGALHDGLVEGGDVPADPRA